MPTLNNRVLDQGLQSLTTEGTRLDICSATPTTYAEATGTLSLGNKTAIGIGAPVDRIPNGRKVVIPNVTGGSITTNGTATKYAITDPTNSRLLVVGDIQAPQAVVTGNTFSFNSFEIEFPGVV